MADIEKVIKAFETRIISDSEEFDTVEIPVGEAVQILELLKEQKQIKSPDEFKSLLLGMFDSIWDVEIEHPVFQDTVGELMEGVLQAYRQAVKC